MLDYWLARGEGFAVVSASGARRRVHHVVVDPRRGSAALVVVASRFGGRLHTLPANAFAAVDPFRRTLYLERPATARAGRALLARAARAGATGIERLRPHVRAGAIGAARSTCAAVDRLRPHARATARTGAALLRAAGIGAAHSTRSGAAWLWPRARAGTRAVAHAAVRTALRLRTVAAELALARRRPSSDVRPAVSRDR